MIQVRVAETNGTITSMCITGHAEYAEAGQDLVCAAVSGIAFGLLNALDELVPSSQLQLTDNIISVKITHPDEKSDCVMRTGLIQLKTVEQQYKKYIKVKMEV